MINSPDFIKRLQIIIDYYQLSAATLADKMNVQRSSISHLLSGRNKPSLDFVLKLIKQFPEVNLYWLLNGLGNFPATLSDNFQPKKDMVLDSENINTNKSNNETKPKVHSNQSNDALIQSIQSNHPVEIESIIICYKNGNFKAYKNTD